MRLISVATLMMIAGGVYVLYRNRASQSASIHPSVKRRLPLAADLSTIHDEQGNYDIDGVSFDTNGVVVSGDGNKKNRVAPLPPAAVNRPADSQFH